LAAARVRLTEIVEGNEKRIEQASTARRVKRAITRSVKPASELRESHEEN
jgi:hypothetical protein